MINFTYIISKTLAKEAKERYNKDTKVGISSTDKSNILVNRNLNNIPSTVTVKYGIISDFAWMRSYPTNHYSNDYSKVYRR